MLNIIGFSQKNLFPDGVAIEGIGLTPDAAVFYSIKDLCDGIDAQRRYA